MVMLIMMAMIVKMTMVKIVMMKMIMMVIFWCWTDFQENVHLVKSNVPVHHNEVVPAHLKDKDENDDDDNDDDDNDEDSEDDQDGVEEVNDDENVDASSLHYDEL